MSFSKQIRNDSAIGKKRGQRAFKILLTANSGGALVKEKPRKWGHSRFPSLILNIAVLVSSFEGGVIYLLLNGGVADWRHKLAVGGTKWRSEVKNWVS